MMYQNFLVIILCVLLADSLSASSTKDQKRSNENYTEFIILEKGVKRTILIPKSSVQNSAKNSNQKDTVKKEGLLIMFENSDQLNLNEFEAKYELEFVTTMRIGYFIFKNNSKYSDMQIISNIMAHETNIITIKPNWKMKKKVR